MHSRTLLPFERDQLSGIVGEIVNMLAQYRSTRGPDMEHYPVIEQVTDSFGFLDDSVLRQTGMVLQVGTEVRFTCVATDPQDRELTWDASVTAGIQLVKRLDSVVGKQVSFFWLIDDTQVSQTVTVLINLTSFGKYHRHNSYGDQRQFAYSVEPPV